MSDIWIFGYGSLLWRPGFDYLESHIAFLPGRQRSLCVYSVVHRGTLEMPGLVFGLDRGGSCLGMAFRVAANEVANVVHYLRAREQVTGVYQEAWQTIWLREPRHRHVRALCYVADVEHAQYASQLDLFDQATIVRTAWGQSGANVEYVLNTVRRLKELKIKDRNMDRLVGILGKRPSHSLARDLEHWSPWTHRLERPKQRLVRIRMPANGQLSIHHRRNLGYSNRLTHYSSYPRPQKASPLTYENH